MLITDKIIMLPVDEVHPYEKNPRENDRTVDLLVKIIPKVGFNVPLVLDKDHVIVKGHARYQAALKLEMTEVPCVISEADPEQIKADRIADNKVFEFSKWLDEELLHEVDMIDFDLDLGDFGLPVMKMEEFDKPKEAGGFGGGFEFEADDDEYAPPSASEEERRRKFEEMLRQEQITTQQAIEHAKMAQAEEVKAPPKYYTVICENCGATMFVREGDDAVWE